MGAGGKIGVVPPTAGAVLAGRVFLAKKGKAIVIFWVD